MEPVLLDKDGPVAWLTLNRPKKRNALSLALMTAMLDKLKIIQQDQDIRVVVIRGNGPAFCAGHDLKEMVGIDLGIPHFHKIMPRTKRRSLPRFTASQRQQDASWLPPATLPLRKPGLSFPRRG